MEPYDNPFWDFSYGPVSRDYIPVPRGYIMVPRGYILVLPGYFPHKKLMKIVTNLLPINRKFIIILQFNLPERK